MSDYDFISIPRGCFLLTKSDTATAVGADLGGTKQGRPGTGFRGVWVDGAGNLKVTFCDMSVGVFSVAAQTRFEGEILNVWSTGTTATVTYGFL